MRRQSRHACGGTEQFRRVDPCWRKSHSSSRAFSSLLSAHTQTRHAGLSSSQRTFSSTKGPPPRLCRFPALTSLSFRDAAMINANVQPSAPDSSPCFKCTLGRKDRRILAQQQTRSGSERRLQEPHKDTSAPLCNQKIDPRRKAVPADISRLLLNNVFI